MEGDQLGTVGAGNIGCGIGAARINHHHLVGEISANSLQTRAQVALLVKHWNCYGDAIHDFEKNTIQAAYDYKNMILG